MVEFDHNTEHMQTHEKIPTTIYVDRIGPILFVPSRRAKRVIISIGLSKGVRVAIPSRVSLKKALEFVHLKEQWVQKHLVRIEQDKNRKRIFEDLAQTIDKVKAKKRLVARLNNLAEEHGFTFNSVSVRNQRTRWGSCSHHNNISLNVKLVLLPEDLIDYVILHELVHTRIHNHSEKFWAELDRFVRNARVVAKRLRTNDLRLA